MKEMYKGMVNSPQTKLSKAINSADTDIYVKDGSVFPVGPNLAVIGLDQRAETVLYSSINDNVLIGCTRGFQGEAKSWEGDTPIARNFTEADLSAVQDNIKTLNKKTLAEISSDENHRTVSDQEKEKWSNKVDKVEGKTLSTNDFTDVAKKKVDAIPSNPKYTDTTYDLSSYAKTTDIKTKLSDMIEDSTHRTVSDTEKDAWNNKVDKVDGKTLSSNDFTNDLKTSLESLIMKNPPSSDFNSVSKAGIYNGSFSTNCPSGNGKYTLFVFPTDSSTHHRENYMFQITVKDNANETPYFRLRRGSSSWGSWYKYSTNDFTDVAKNKVDAIPSNPKYTDTVTTVNGKTGAISKPDIVALGIPGSAKTYSVATASSDGLMSSGDKKKLDEVKTQIILTESAYNALSTSQQNDPNKIYFIKA